MQRRFSWMLFRLTFSFLATTVAITTTASGQYSRYQIGMNLAGADVPARPEIQGEAYIAPDCRRVNNSEIFIVAELPHFSQAFGGRVGAPELSSLRFIRGSPANGLCGGLIV
jgi:hypothetical protein